MTGYRAVLAEKISTLPHVANTSTYVAMQAVKEERTGPGRARGAQLKEFARDILHRPESAHRKMGVCRAMVLRRLRPDIGLTRKLQTTPDAGVMEW